METYKEMTDRHETEMNAFPLAFAFSDKQFDEGMKKLGLDPSETDKVVSLGHLGGFMRKTDAKAYHELHKRMSRELKEAIEEDKTGEGFIFDMFDYELGNHEYIVTYSIESTLDALCLTYEEVEASPALSNGLKLAKKSQKEWAEKND